MVSFVAPILYRGNRIVGSIGVSGPQDRFLLGACEDEDRSRQEFGRQALEAFQP
jgi:DNA-binding IclR family transcriptional regulator